jgi:chromosome segregation ATPase
MARMLVRSAVAVGAGMLPLLAACESDPAKGGFLSGVYNLSTGGYQQRVSERERSLEQVRLEQAALAGERAKVEREHAEIVRELNLAEVRVQALDRRIAALNQQIRSERAAYADEQRDLREAEARLAAMRSSIRRLDATNDPTAITREGIADVNRRLDELASFIDGMTERLPSAQP